MSWWKCCIGSNFSHKIPQFRGSLVSRVTKIIVSSNPNLDMFKLNVFKLRGVVIKQLFWSCNHLEPLLSSIQVDSLTLSLIKESFANHLCSENCNFFWGGACYESKRQVSQGLFVCFVRGQFEITLFFKKGIKNFRFINKSPPKLAE